MDTSCNSITRRTSNVIQAFCNLIAESMMFYDFFILIQLEYLINRNHPDPMLKMSIEALSPGAGIGK